MPFVNVKMIEGFTQEQKDRIIKAYTDATIEILKIDPQKFTIVFDEYPLENWAKGGVKISQMKK